MVTFGGYQSGYGIIKRWIPDWIPPHHFHAGYLAKLDIGTARGGAATKRLAELINPLICSTTLRMSSQGFPNHCQSFGFGFGFVQFD